MDSYYFIKIPKDIIYCTDIDNKRALMFAYFCMKRTFDNNVQFSINHLCTWMKFKPNNKKGNINDQIYKALDVMKANDYFHANESIAAKNGDSLITLQINCDKFDSCNNFAVIYIDELQKILNFKSELGSKSIDVGSITPACLLLVLAYIRANMFGSSGCFRYYKTIASDIGVSRYSIAKAVNILSYLNIIVCDNCNKSTYSNESKEIKFNSGFKVFVNARRFIKDTHGRIVLDASYSAIDEISKQISLLNKNEK